MFTYLAVFKTALSSSEWKAIMSKQPALEHVRSVIRTLQTS